MGSRCLVALIVFVTLAFCFQGWTFGTLSEAGFIRDGDSGYPNSQSRSARTWGSDGSALLWKTTRCSNRLGLRVPIRVRCQARANYGRIHWIRRNAVWDRPVQPFVRQFAAAGFISSQLGQDHVYDGLSNAAALAVQRATRKPFRTTLPSRQDVRRHSWTADDEIRGHCAMPLVTGLVGSCDVNRTIPEFLLDPVFTAVRAADTHKAQSMVALWKKPGVPRVGWTEDMSCPPSTKLLHSSVSDPGSGCETFVSQPSDAWLDGTQRGQQADKASGGLTPQGEAMVIMTGTSASHLDSLAEAVIVAMWETHMRKLLGRDGRGYSGWIVLAFMDLEVHIMTPVTRERYALEELYKLCPRIDISDCIRVGSLEPFDLYRESFRTARDSHEPPFCSEEV